MIVSDEEFIVSCPKCGQESFEVDVEESGTSFNWEFGLQEHWWVGRGKCDDCGHECDYSDSSL